MAQTVINLGQLVKQKYAGVYDDMNDAEVGRAVKTKFPGAYDDFTDVPEAAKPVEAEPTLYDKAYKYAKAALTAVGGDSYGAGLDSVVGAAKGVGDSAHRVVSGLQGAMNTAKQQTAGDLRRMGVPEGTTRQITKPIAVTPQERPDFLNPSNTAQSIGYFGEQAAEFAVPSIKAGSALKAAPTIARVGAEAGIAGGVGLAHGQTPQEAGISAVVAGAIPGIGSKTGPLWQRAKAYLHRRITPRAINSLMEVNPKWIEHGRDPGGRVVKEGIVASTKEGLKSQVDDQLKQVGQALQIKLSQGVTQIDADGIVMNALDNATKKIGRRSDAEFQNALSNIMSDILGKVPNLKQLTPLQAHKLKKEIGESIGWSGMKYEDDLNQALLEMYRGLNDAIDAAVPGAKALQAKWGDFFIASKSLKDALNKEMTRPLASGQGMFANVGRAVGTALPKTVSARMLHSSLNPAGSTPSRVMPRLIGSSVNQVRE